MTERRLTRQAERRKQGFSNLGTVRKGRQMNNTENKVCDACGVEIPDSEHRSMSDIDTYECDECEASGGESVDNMKQRLADRDALGVEPRTDNPVSGTTMTVSRHVQGLTVESAAHSVRFRAVSTAYANRVAGAYGGDLAAAARATDTEVAERVATWERENGLPVRDWQAIGAEERDGDGE